MLTPRLSRFQLPSLLEMANEYFCGFLRSCSTCHCARDVRAEPGHRLRERPGLPGSFFAAAFEILATNADILV
jgi:hypothetical protein